MVKHPRRPLKPRSNFRPLIRPLPQRRLLLSRLRLHHLRLYPLLLLHRHRQHQLPSQLRHRRRRRLPTPFPNTSPNSAGRHGSSQKANLRCRPTHLHLPLLLQLLSLLRPLRLDVNAAELVKAKPLRLLLRHFLPWYPILTGVLSTI